MTQKMYKQIETMIRDQIIKRNPKMKGLVKVDDRKRKGKSGRSQLVMWATEFYQGEDNG